MQYIPYQKFTKEVGIFSLTNLLVGLKGLIILPIITKLLGTESYGIWAQIMVTISLTTLLVTLGLPYTLVRFLPAEKDKKEIQDGVYSVLSLVFIVGLIISIFFIFFSKSIANFFGTDSILIKILAFIILFECFNLVFLNIFRAFREIKKYSFFVIFQAVAETSLIIVAISFGYGILGAILALLIASLTVFLIMGWVVIKKIGVKIPHFSRTKKYLSFGLPGIPANISSWIVQSSDRYLIGFFWGATFVGYYSPAYALGNIITFFIAPLSFTLPAVLSKFFDENQINEVKVHLKYSLKYFLMVAIPSVFGLSILSKQLLLIFSTSEIASRGYLVVFPVALSILLLGIYTVIVQIIILRKRTIIIGAIWMIAALLNLGLNFIFIPKFGIMGAAITTLIAYTTVFIITWHYSFRGFKFNIDWKFIIKSIFASVLMTLFIIWFSPIGLLKTIIAIISGALLYGILILLFKGFNKKEIEFLKGFLKTNLGE